MNTQGSDKPWRVAQIIIIKEVGEGGGEEEYSIVWSGVVGGAVGENREKGGWAEQCPTGGGTDEVGKKWREKGKKI